MQLSTALFKTLMDHLQEAVYFVDKDRRIQYWNLAAEKLTGFTAEEVVGHCCHENILAHIGEDGENMCNTVCPLASAIHDAEPRTTQAFLHHKEGHRVPVMIRTAPVHDDSGQVIGAVESFVDNTSSISALDRIKELESQILLCPLTAVGNRRYAMQFMTERFDEWKRFGWSFGVLFLDVDHFKQFNDRFGHAVGDVVLKMVANTLRHNLRSFDFVARWGGEEFVVVLPKVTVPELVNAADRLRVLIQNTARDLTQRKTEVTVSVGAAIVEPEDTIDTLVARADKQMYLSKTQGRNRVNIAASTPRRLATGA